MIEHLRYFLFSVVGCMLISTAALASSLSIEPVHVVLGQGKTVAAIHITNSSNRTMVLQADGFAWQQKNSKDVYTKTQDLLITPPLITLKPGVMQLFRVAYLKSIPKTQETGYRIYFQQVVPKLRKDKGLFFALKIGIPVFIEQQAPLIEALQWQGRIKNKKTLLLSLKNAGNTHIQISNIELAKLNSEKAFYSHKTFQYVLPAQSHQWTLSVATQSLPKSLHLMIHTNKGLLSQTVKLK